MFTILFVVGGVWLVGSVLLMAGLALATKRPAPSCESESLELEQAA